PDGDEGRCGQVVEPVGRKAISGPLGDSLADEPRRAESVFGGNGDASILCRARNRTWFATPVCRGRHRALNELFLCPGESDGPGSEARYSGVQGDATVGVPLYSAGQ